MRYNICVVTTTRADYGILRPLLCRMSEDDAFNVTIAVGGTHLSESFGNTIDEIVSDSYGSIIKFDYLYGSSNAIEVCKSASNAHNMFSEILSKNAFDLVIILGDRYEMLAIAEASFIHRVPIAHIHGGEVTEGALDDNIRHAITKLSYLHFTANESYKHRVVQLGEEPDRVYDVGALGVEAINSINLMSKEELADDLKINLDEPYILMTYHPETNSDKNPLDEIEIVLEAIDNLDQYSYIITKANSDQGGQLINDRLSEFTEKKDNVYLFDSLGSLRYLSIMKYSEMVLGNSSSGIIEAPSMGVPTVNIGDRQKGRMRAASVVDSPLNKDLIVNTVNYVSLRKREEGFDYLNPYGSGDTSYQICKIIKEKLNANVFEKHKRFYDIDMEKH